MDKITRYLITDGQHYASDSNCTKLSTKKSEAFEWRNETSAKAVLKQAKNRKPDSTTYLNNNYNVIEVHYYESEIESDIVMDLKTIQSFLDIVKYCHKYENAIRDEKDIYHNQMVDLEHYIEFTDLDVQRGYKIYKKLQEVRQHRRDAKNRLKIIETVNGLNIDEEVLDRLIKDFKEMCYKPRQIDFDDIFK